MPKKRNNSFRPIKPPSSVHPSLSSSSAGPSNSPAVPQRSSVNELIEQSRKAHSTFKVAAAEALTPTPTLSSIPLSTRVSQAASLRALQQRLNPDERTAAGRRARRPPGPAPPPSWSSTGIGGPLSTSIHAPTSLDEADGWSRYTLDSNLPIPILPSQPLPVPGSLQDLGLRSMCRHWEWHVENDGQWLETIPTALKSALILYLTRSCKRLSSHELRYLFDEEHQSSEDVDESWDRDESQQMLTHLTIGPAVGINLSWKQLSGLCKEQAVKPAHGDANLPTTALDITSDPARAPSSSRHRSRESQGSSGEESENPQIPAPFEQPRPRYSTPIFPISSVLKFSAPLRSLTHLSLAHIPEPSYNQLISLLSNLPYLTHLSLAHWEPLVETLHTAAGGNAAAPPHLHTAPDPEMALRTLRRIGKSSPRLEWLDLSGPGNWVAMFQEEETSSAELSFEDGSNPRTGLRAFRRGPSSALNGSKPLLKRISTWQGALGSLRTLRVGPCGCGIGRCSVPHVLRLRDQFSHMDGSTEHTWPDYRRSMSGNVAFARTVSGRPDRYGDTTDASTASVPGSPSDSSADCVAMFKSLPQHKRSTTQIRETLAKRVDGIRLERHIRAKRLEADTGRMVACAVEMEGADVGYAHITHSQGSIGSTLMAESKFLGTSNLSTSQVEALFETADTQPRLAPWVRDLAERWLRKEDVGVGWTWEDYASFS